MVFLSFFCEPNGDSLFLHESSSQPVASPTPGCVQLKHQETTSHFPCQTCGTEKVFSLNELLPQGYWEGVVNPVDPLNIVDHEQSQLRKDGSKQNPDILGCKSYKYWL